MSDPMIVPFDLGNARQMMAAMGAVADQTQQMARGYQQALGPAQRLVQAQMQLRNAGLYGSYAQQFDARFLHQKAQAAYNRAAGIQTPGAPDPGKALSNFLRTTRFGGHGVMPLAGRTFDLLKGLTGSGAGAGVAAAAVAAIAALTEAAKKAADTLNTLGAARWLGGGTGADAARAQAIGGALGMQAGTVAQMAAQLAGRLASPEGMLYGSRYGARDPLGDTSFGALNRFKNLFKMIEGLAGDPNEGRAIRAARATGLEAFLQLRDLSRDMRRQVLAQMEAIGSPEQVRAAADFRAAVSLASMELDRMTVEIGGPVLKVLVPAVRAMGDAVRYGSMLFKALLVPLQGTMDWFRRIFDALSNVFDRINRLLFGDKAQTGFGAGGTGIRLNAPSRPAREGQAERQRQATEDNTAALRDQIATMKGVFGGGERARAVYPGKLGLQMNNAALRNSIRLGAYAL